MIVRGNVFSKTLEMDTGVTIVAPNDFKTVGKYKVAYLFHGLCGNSQSWVDTSMLPVYAAAGNTIYVMPEVARSFYANMEYGLQYFSYVAEELPLICNRVFNISSNREDTIVMGSSMGGYGALKCALSKPQQYGSCAAFSSACLFLKEDLNSVNGDKDKFRALYGDRLLEDFSAAFGDDLHADPRNDLLELAKGIEDLETKPVIYMTCGTEDGFHGSNVQFSKKMTEMAFDFTFEEWKGAHDFMFFNEALKKAIDRFEL